MTEFPKCRFLETVLQVPTKGIDPEELQGFECCFHLSYY